MVDLIITDPQHQDLAEIQDASLDLAYGDSENDFQLTLGPERLPPGPVGQGSLVYIDGTDYGGVIDSVCVDHKDGASTLTYSGRTWQGLLAAKSLYPPAGTDYLTVPAGTSLAAGLGQVLSPLGLTGFLTPSPSLPAITTSKDYQFDRVTDAYTGLRKWLGSLGLGPRLEYQQGQLILSTPALQSYGDLVDSDLMDFTAQTDYRPVNHLVGLGQGDLGGRARSDWYADSSGQVSQTQSLTGLDEVCANYDSNGTSAADLPGQTRQKLQDLQVLGSLSVSVHDGLGLNIGDTVITRDNLTGLRVTATVTKKIVKLEGDTLSVSYTTDRSQ